MSDTSSASKSVAQKQVSNKPGGLWSLLKPRASWVSVLTSLASFAIATFTFVSTRQPPSVQVILPQQVRVAQSAEQGALLYLQPALIATGASQRSEVVLDMSLQAQPTAGGQAGQFVWDENGEWIFDPQSGELSWQYAGDPGPMLLNPGTAQAPTVLFLSEAGWRFEPGSYRLQLKVQGAAEAGALQAEAVVTLAQSDVTYLEQAGGNRFLTFELTH